MERHDAFTAWLAGRALAELQRDVAIHASACPDCLRAAGAFDALGHIDVGGAPEPPITAVEPEPGPSLVRGSLWVAGLTIVLAIATTGAMAANGVFQDPAAGELEVISASPTVDATTGGAVLGNRSSSEPSVKTAEPSATDAGPSASGGDPSASQGQGALGPKPTTWGVPVSVGPYRPAASPSLIATPRATPAATPDATATPAPTPTATPVPTPTPTPTASPVTACSNSADDDGDGLIDFGEDPGCESAADNDETDPPPP